MKIRRSWDKGIWTVILSYKGVQYVSQNKSHDLAMKEAFSLV